MKCKATIGAHWGLAALALFLAAGAAVASGRVETIDFRVLEGTVDSLNDKEVTILVANEKKAIPLEDLAQIELGAAADALAAEGQALIVTAGGDQLPARDLVGREGKLSFSNEMLGRAEMPLSVARALYLPSPGSTARQVQGKSDPLLPAEQTQDVLVAKRKDGSLVAVEGIFKAIDAKMITLNYDGEDRQTSREMVFAVRLAAVAEGKDHRAGAIVGIDGSILGFTSAVMDGEFLSADTPSLGRLKIPRKNVASIRFVSRRLVLLTDLKPAAVTEHGFFDKAFPYQINATAGGGPLKLGGRSYSVGLGLHSFCELTYKLEGPFTAFVALAGIDDSARPLGDAKLTFLGDGKELDKPLRLTGKSDPAPVRLNLTGVKELVIRVEFGEDRLDVGDRVDLVNPRLIKGL